MLNKKMSAFILLFKNINKKKKVSSVNRHLSVVEVCPSATRGFLWGLSRQLCQKNKNKRRLFHMTLYVNIKGSRNRDTRVPLWNQAWG